MICIYLSVEHEYNEFVRRNAEIYRDFYIYI